MRAPLRRRGYRIAADAPVHGGGNPYLGSIRRYHVGMPRLDASSVRAYLARDWAAVRRRKREYWRERLDRGGLAEALRVSALLYEPASDEDREEDLQTHQRVAEALAKTAPRRRTATPRARRIRRVR
jgi:hypothetical protein